MKVKLWEAQEASVPAIRLRDDRNELVLELVDVANSQNRLGNVILTISKSTGGVELRPIDPRWGLPMDTSGYIRVERGY